MSTEKAYCVICGVIIGGYHKSECLNSGPVMPGDTRITEATVVKAKADAVPQAKAPAADGELSKKQIDDIVYRCRQSGDDSTYAIVKAAIAADRASRDRQPAGALSEQERADMETATKLAFDDGEWGLCQRLADLAKRMDRQAAPTLSSVPQAEPCKTCGGTKVDPGGLPICRDCGHVSDDEPPLHADLIYLLEYIEKSAVRDETARQIKAYARTYHAHMISKLGGESIDTPEFRDLIEAHDAACDGVEMDAAYATICAHIDAFVLAKLAQARADLQNAQFIIEKQREQLAGFGALADAKIEEARAAGAEPVAMMSGALNHARDALRFYAQQEHFVMHEPDVWDTVSGEPQNFYEDENNTATVEDGSVAKKALEDIAHVESYASIVTERAAGGSVEGGQYIPRNFTTHRSAWRDAITECINVETAKGNRDQAAYWQHELDAYDRSFARLLDKPEPIRGSVEGIIRYDIMPDEGGGSTIGEDANGEYVKFFDVQSLIAASRRASGAGDGIPAHLREFVEAIANNYTAYDSGHDETSCRGCSALVSDGDGSVAHQPDCIVPRAQAMLAAAPEASAEEAHSQADPVRLEELIGAASLYAQVYTAARCIHGWSHDAALIAAAESKEFGPEACASVETLKGVLAEVLRVDGEGGQTGNDTGAGGEA